MAYLTREAILNAQDRKTETVSVAGWGGEVIIGTMSGHARDQFERQMLDKKSGQKNIRAKLAAATIQDEEGNLLFTEKDIEKLGDKSGAELDKVFSAALKLNRIGDADVDELAKNS